VRARQQDDKIGLEFISANRRDRRERLKRKGKGKKRQDEEVDDEERSDDEESSSDDDDDMEEDMAEEEMGELAPAAKRRPEPIQKQPRQPAPAAKRRPEPIQKQPQISAASPAHVKNTGDAKIQYLLSLSKEPEYMKQVQDMAASMVHSAFNTHLLTDIYF
jgi:hypothetical protein